MPLRKKRKKRMMFRRPSVSKFRAVLAIAILCALSWSANTAENTGWYADSAYQRRLLIQLWNSGRTARSDVVVLLRLGPTRIYQPEITATGYGDFLLTDDLSTTLYSHETKFVDGMYLTWVHVPSVLASNANYMYLYYMNANSARGLDLPGTWPTPYEVVHHFDKDVAGLVLNSLDASSHGLLFPGGGASPAYVVGMAGKGLEFSGAQHVDVEDNQGSSGPYLGFHSQFTLGLWIKRSGAPSSEETLVAKDVNPVSATKPCRTQRSFEVLLGTDGKIQFSVFAGCLECFDFERYDCRVRSFGTFASQSCTHYPATECYVKERHTFAGYFPNRKMYYTCTSFTKASSQSVTDGNWHYVVVLKDGVVGKIGVSIDGYPAEWLSTGALVVQQEQLDMTIGGRKRLTSAVLAGATCRVAFGTTPTYERLYSGLIDEVSYANGLLSDDGIEVMHRSVVDGLVTILPTRFPFSETLPESVMSPGAGIVVNGRLFSDDADLKCCVGSGDVVGAAFISAYQVWCFSLPLRGHGDSDTIRVVYADDGATRNFQVVSPQGVFYCEYLLSPCAGALPVPPFFQFGAFLMRESPPSQ